MKITEIIAESYLTEIKAPEVNVAYKLLNDMPPNAKKAIISWEYSMWTTGDLEQAYKTKNDTWKTIETYATQLRETIRKQYGDTITLYRGLKNDSQQNYKHESRILYSWTTRKEVAAVFADLASINDNNKIILHKNKSIKNKFLLSITDEEAKTIQDTVIKNNKAKYKNMFFIVNPNDENFVNVYIKKRYSGYGEYDFYTDYEKTKLADGLIDERNDMQQFNQDIISKNKDNGYVVIDEIPVDDIVWVLNNGKPPYNGTLEYIVKNNSGLNSQKINL